MTHEKFHDIQDFQASRKSFHNNIPLVAQNALLGPFLGCEKVTTFATWYEYLFLCASLPCDP